MASFATQAYGSGESALFARLRTARLAADDADEALERAHGSYSAIIAEQVLFHSTYGQSADDETLDDERSKEAGAALPAPEPPAPAVGSTRPRSPGAEAAAAALRAFGPKALKKEIKERGLQERSEGMVEKAELVALLLEDGWRPPQEDSDDETDDEERTRLC